MEATNTLEFCISCHEMESTVYQEYKTTIHYQNRTGVRAVCSDCHVPKSWVHKMVRKVKASKEVYHKILGSINTSEKFEAKRLHLAKNVWREMKATDSRECRNCHTINSMNPEFQRPRARKQHMAAMKAGQTCIDCHKGIAHKSVRHLVSAEELEELEKPDPSLAFTPIPQTFLDGLKRVEEKEAAEEKKKLAEYAEAEADVEARIKEAVTSAVATEAAKHTAAATTAPAGEQSAASPDTSSVDWSKVATKNVTLFYPGQASFEWVQTGKDHGGARAFAKLGDRCSTCHGKEVKDMGAKIVSGEKLEPTPIAGKRGHIDVKVQATHDDKNLYLRFRWKDDKHTPVPFVDGGKMDPENQVKLAMMLAANEGGEDGPKVELVNQAGCWATCHHDSRYMPHKPKPEDMEKFADVAKRLEMEDGITKYIKSSRTKIEVKGRRGKIRGGWQKLKDQEELDTLLKDGSFLDLYRFSSGAKAENGHVAASRTMKDTGEFTATGKLVGKNWTVTMVRPLKSETSGDIAIEPGKLYTVGFAIHDDFTDARFHHVSLEYYLGLDNDKADINVAK
jgi:cytochrome c-type protein NapC